MKLSTVNEIYAFICKFNSKNHGHCETLSRVTVLASNGLPWHPKNPILNLKRQLELSVLKKDGYIELCVLEIYHDKLVYVFNVRYSCEHVELNATLRSSSEL